MRILVCGGRDYSDRTTLDNFLDLNRSEFTVLISGAQRRFDKQLQRFVGADYFAIEWAWKNEIPFIGIPAQWTKQLKAAGPIRNQIMIDHWEPQKIIAFPGGNGTRDLIKFADFRNIPVVYAPGW